MEGLDRITFDPEVKGGRACIRGTRITVSLILNLLAKGNTREQILEAYPDLEPEDIQAALKYAEKTAGKSEKEEGNEKDGYWFENLPGAAKAAIIVAIITALGGIVAAIAPRLIECILVDGPTPTPRVILLEDFEPQRAMTWWSSDSDVFRYEETNSHADGGAYSLQVDYAKTDTYQFIAAEIPSHRRNFQATDELQVSVYGEVTLLVKLEDENLKQAEVCTKSGTDAQGWTRVSCEYTAVGDSIDLGHVKHIFFFPAPGDNAAKGTFYLDHVLLKE